MKAIIWMANRGPTAPGDNILKTAESPGMKIIQWMGGREEVEGTEQA